MKKWILLLVLFALPTGISAQECDVPKIGAQVFIEPGQMPDDIDRFFRILRDNGLKVARVRMFGAHMYRDGQWNFDLYDEAFRAAERYGIRLFATLFPLTDELTDVGGFKFPSSKRHLSEVDEYVTQVVTHFRKFPALWAWVLQNEPGTGGVRIQETDLSREVYAAWEASRRPSEYDNGYLKADFRQEEFLTFYTTWYLRHIADLVTRLDPEHGRHINPHQILSTLPDYDFTAYRKFLTSLGVSMHLSWHFGIFTTPEYPVGVSLMADIIRANACGNPFWVTELQGGNVTASGAVPYCPTAAHTAQYLWVSLAAGAEGVIFWTLNQRAAVQEAGEWGLLDFQRHPSDRLRAAAEVASVVERYGDAFRRLRPVDAPVTLLYNVESIRIQRRNAETLVSKEPGRQADAVMKSLATAYMAISSWGVTPAVEDMKCFDWRSGAGRVAVIPNMVSLPSDCWNGIRQFVASGGKLIVTGLSGFYDENMYCLFMNGFPLASCFGAEVSEFKVAGDRFSLGGDLTAHLWRGILCPTEAVPERTDHGEIVGTRHRFGAGEVVWIPSPIELGSYHDDTAMAQLAVFYGQEIRTALDTLPAVFETAEAGVLMRTMQDGKGPLLTVVVNKRDKEAVVPLKLQRKGDPEVIFGDKAAYTAGQLHLAPDSCVVLLWS